LALGGLLGLALTQATAGGEAGKTGFLDRIHKDANGKEVKYVLFVPEGYKGDKEYPLILFLHGAGETGTDGRKQVKVGLGKAIGKREKTFEFLAIFPQSQKGGWKADSAEGKRALAILDEVQKDYKVDPKRIYLTGLSMGGAGTWSLATAHPDRWAAIVPICGRGDPAQADKVKDLPCWCFVGDKDNEKLVKNSRDMMKALWDVGGHPNYTEYPGVGHNCWDATYGNDYLYQWLLKHKRK
jgi:predicted peptidase